MNIFRILASGKQGFREEFASAFLAYLFSPKMDHGLGYTFLSMFLKEIAVLNNLPGLTILADDFKVKLREDIFSDESGQVAIELEVAYPKSSGTSGFIDIVVRCGNTFIIIENKIVSGSLTCDQISEQYEGFKKVLEKNKVENPTIYVLYLVPAYALQDTWEVGTSFKQELEKLPTELKALVTWQPAPNVVSIVGLIRDLLRRETDGTVPPISSELRHSLISLANFAIGNFSGFHYQNTSVKNYQVDKMRVADILNNISDPVYIGFQYGRGGVISSAWKDNKNQFLNLEASVTATETGNWQYLPLNDFKIVSKWAMNPEQESLEGLEWSGKPFYTENLYRVGKWGKIALFVGMRGGIDTLKEMTEEQIRNYRNWNLSSEQKSGQWFPIGQFIDALENKNIKFT